MDWQHMGAVAGATLTAFGLKVIGALIAWIIGRYLIGLALRLIGVALTRQEVDATLQRYIGNIVNVALNIVLVVAILGYFGVETTSFAALIAGMGVAIGAAWAGLLANFAAGRLPDRAASVQGRRLRKGGRPRRHREGDRVVRHDHSHSRQHQQLRRQQQDLRRHHSEFFGQPLSACRTYRQLAHTVDVQDAVRRLKDALAKIPNVH
jgi:small-conductance mechanosensitive channel